jgi:hypothetical protein
VPRTIRTTAHPLLFREGSSAAPIGPETPLTRILEFMLCRVSLYQFAERLNKFKKRPNASKGMKEKKDENEICEPENFVKTLRLASVSS